MQVRNFFRVLFPMTVLLLSMITLQAQSGTFGETEVTSTSKRDEEQQLRREVYRRLDQVRRTLKLAEQQQQDARLEKLLAAESLRKGKAGKAKGGELKSLEKNLETAEKNEKAAVKKIKDAEKQVSSLEKISNYNVTKLRKYLSAASAETVAKQSDPEPKKQEKTKTEDKEKTKTSNPVLPAPASKPESYKTYDPKFDTNFNPPVKPCAIAFEGKDELTGKNRRDMEKAIFFTHTDQRIRAYFKERDYLICEAYLSTIGQEYYFLHVKYTLATKNAPMEFGSIEKGSALVVNLLNGDSVRLQAVKSDQGSPDPVNETFIYQMQYNLNLQQLKELQISEIDKVRMVWSAGYEDYEVYDLDFLKRQAMCIEKATK